MITGGIVRSADNGRLGTLSGSFSGEAINLLKSAPGKNRWRDRVWYFEPTAGNVEFLQRQFPHLEWRDDGVLAGRVETIRAQEKAAATVLAGDAEVTDFEFKTVPYKHQRRGFLLARDRDFFYLRMDMGTGKTKVSLDVAAWRAMHAGLRLMIVLAPNGVHRKWVERELPLHWAGGPTRSILWGEKNRPARADEIETADRTTPPGTLIVVAINVEALSQGKTSRPAAQLIRLIADVRRSGGKTLIVLDEGTRIKNPGATRAKVAHALGALADHRLELSGAPVTKGVENLYSQMQWLSHDILDCRSMVAFRAQYCRMGGFEGREIIGYRNLDDLRRRIDPWMFSIDKEDCLDLPPKVFEEVPVDLSPLQKRVYTELRDELLTKLDSGETIEPTNALASLTQLQCIANGYVPIRDPETNKVIRREMLGGSRPQIITDMWDETSGQFVVWCRFRYDVDDVLAALAAAGMTAVRYDGSVSSEQRAENLAAFTRGDAQGFVGTPAAGGIGIDLVSAALVAFYSNSYNAEERWQAEDRNHRIGQKRAVNYFDLVARGTVDRAILTTLKNRANVADMVLRPEKLKEMLGG